MASIKVLFRHQESGDQWVVEFDQDDPLDIRLFVAGAKADGWLPVRRINEARESTGAPAGFRRASAFLRP